MFGKSDSSVKRHLKNAQKVVTNYKNAPGSTLDSMRSRRYRTIGEKMPKVLLFLAQNGILLEEDNPNSLPAEEVGVHINTSLPQASPPSPAVESALASSDWPPLPVGIEAAEESDSETQESDSAVMESSSDEEITQDELDRLPLSGEAFVDALRQMAIETGASYAMVDTWLKILHNKKAKPDYKTLPKDSGGMFDPSYVLMQNFVVRDMMAFRPKSATVTAQRAHDANAMGSYVYFGLEKNLLAESPGQYMRRAYIAMLKRVEAASPLLLPKQYREAMYDGHVPDTHVESADKACDSIMFTLKLFTDGAPVFMNSSKSSIYPLLASVHSICPFDEKTGKARRDESKN